MCNIVPTNYFLLDTNLERTLGSEHANGMSDSTQPHPAKIEKINNVIVCKC